MIPAVPCSREDSLGERSDRRRPLINDQAHDQHARAADLGAEAVDGHRGARGDTEVAPAVLPVGQTGVLDGDRGCLPGVGALVRDAERLGVGAAVTGRVVLEAPGTGPGVVVLDREGRRGPLAEGPPLVDQYVDLLPSAFANRAIEQSASAYSSVSEAPLVTVELLLDVPFGT
jgi:hypothetical protein